MAGSRTAAGGRLRVSRRGPIAWMAGNPVTANLLMLFLLLGGFFWGSQIRQEIFPEFTLDLVQVRVVYPGATPEDVAEGIILPIEEAIESVDGIKEVVSVADEGVGTVRVEAELGTDLHRLALDIKNEVDRIYSFPEEAEEPQVTIPSHKSKVVTLLLYGRQAPRVLREITEVVRDRLLQDPGITRVELLGDRPLEISIEVPAETLEAYNLRLSDIAARVRDAARDIPGGTIETRGGDILVRMAERKDYAPQFARIPIITGADGTIVTLGEIARIRDTFEDLRRYVFYNRIPALGIEVFRVGRETPITISDAVARQVRELKKILPAGISLAIVDDYSTIFRQRISLLLRNGALGLVLVFGLLALFLEIRLAFWVTMGIPISFLGALLILPAFGVSINMVSLFAFIIALGIVVDDAIVVGENIYHYRQLGYDNFSAAVAGCREVAAPVTFSVLTNIAAFLPLYFVPGFMGKIFRLIPVVVISVFTISLLEALFVLPAHLAHSRRRQGRLFAVLERIQQRFSALVTRFIHNGYGPFLHFSLRFRYISMALGVVVLLLTLAYVRSGRLGMTMFPKVDADYAYVRVVLPVGAPAAAVLEVENLLVDRAEQLAGEIGRERELEGVLSFVNGNSVWVKAYLTPPKVRPVSTAEFTRRWRELVGGIPGIESIKFESDQGGPGAGAVLTVELQHRDTATLAAASAELARALGSYPLVSDVDDGFTPGKIQYEFTLNDAGFRLGLRPAEVARQIRSAYYGFEVFRQLRGRNEMKIMVRLPPDERATLHSLEEMLILTPQGVKVPLLEVVDIHRGRAYTTIERRNGRRVVNVTCDVNPRSRADIIKNALVRDVLPQLVEKYHGLSYSFAGRQTDRRESMAVLVRGMFITLMLVYLLLAIPFRSYIQPLIIMISIPFGIVGAIAGHLLMGYSLSILSMFGIVALSGVVVNDSLVLIDFANRREAAGATPYEAITSAGIQRFRPIILTTMTTFFGLMPMIFETSRQSRFLIPMAISLGFGILFSTLIILVMVPALYMILDDCRRMLG